MKEIIAQYSSEPQPNWLQRKITGLFLKYFRLKRHLSWHWHILFHPVRVNKTRLHPGSMPVLINNFNRLTPLKQQLQWLLSLDDNISIIIVDNHSNYPPLLEYYRSINHPRVQVIRLGINSWLYGVELVGKKLTGFDKYIITDPDLLPYSDTPSDVIGHLSKLLDRYPDYNHIGLSLEINDLPVESLLTEKVRRHEMQFWMPKTALVNNEVLVAPIDSTFAMYRKSSRVRVLGPALRTNRPYTLRHIDWYLKPVEYTDEYRMYLKTCKTVATWATEIKRTAMA